jgi:hypothetical protein
MLMIARILYGLPSIPLGDKVSQELTGWYTEGALLCVELDAVVIEVGEGFAQIVEQVVCFPGLDDDIIDIYFDVADDLLLQASLHAPLIGGSSVLQAKRHHHVAVNPVSGAKRSLVFVFDLQSDLVVS